MIISGICATAHADLQGHVLLAGAADVTRRGIPLCLEHGNRQIGEVMHMMYAGHDLYCVCELDDEAASQLNHFSVAGRPIHRELHGSLWHVSKFHLHEISLVRVPQNDRCKVLERKPSDPFRALHKSHLRQHDLFIQAFGNLSRSLQEIARHVG